jgi:hypothetical protein
MASTSVEKMRYGQTVPPREEIQIRAEILVDEVVSNCRRLVLLFLTAPEL